MVLNEFLIHWTLGGRVMLVIYSLRRLGQGEILTQIGAGFGLRIMGIIIKKTKSLRKSSYNVVYVTQ